MKALTITQPWAQLIALGYKSIETRSWHTDYRGPLAIHAAKGYKRADGELCWEEPFLGALMKHRPPVGMVPAPGRMLPWLPVGCVVATATLVSVVRVDELAVFERLVLAPNDRAFGNFAPGHWAWLLADVTPLDAPIRATGALQLWDWEDPR